MSWKKLALLNLFLYAVDMTIAIVGFVYGFGITVKNWWVVIGVMIVSRFVFHIVHAAMNRAAAERWAEQKRAQP